MLNISLMSQGLPESSRAPSVLPPLSSATSGMQGHQTVKTDPTYEPGSQVGIEEGQREGVGEYVKGTEGVMFASPAQSQHHEETSATACAGGH